MPARWRLITAHYLRVPGTEWEYKEQDMTSKRQVKHTFEVPLLLNPADQADHNYPGEIIVSNEPNGRDYVFVGEPTPDMEPVNDEAKAISESLAEKWIHPIESLPATGEYSQSLLKKLESQIDELIRTQGRAPAPASTSVSQDDFEALKAQVAQLMERNAQLEAAAPRRV